MIKKKTKNKISIAESYDKKNFIHDKQAGSLIRKERIFVMMSGGVDSSVAAYLLKKSGKYEVIGAFIKGYNVDGCQEKEAEDARRVAEFLDIPFYTIDLEKEYKKRVVDYMIGGYRKGITPNPDVVCNKEIKFGLFLSKALELGADYVATGHYVRLASRHISHGTGHLFAPAAKSSLDSLRVRPVYNENQAERAYETFRSKHGGKLVSHSLFEAKDKNKDQSYFLWTLAQEQLRHCLFPIGDYLKSEVRRIAKKAGIPVAEKKDSQGICFLGQFNVRDFLKQFLPAKKGDIVMAGGKKIGEHDGAWFYTIGQRHLGNVKWNMGHGGNSRKPLYVISKDVKKNVLIVADGETEAVLTRKEIGLVDTNFINPFSIKHFPLSIFVRGRYRQPLVPAKINKARSGYQLIFYKPQKFIANGQSAVFYDKDGQMIGGGVIK